jgi:hypothetical protein
MSKTIIVIYVILLLSYSAGWASDQDKEVFEYEIVAAPHEGYEIKDGQIYYRSGKAGLILEPATVDVIEKYFTDRGSSVTNPFIGTDPELENGTYFLLSLINRSKGSLTFTPRYVALKIKTEASFPIDFTVLLGILQNMDPYNKKLIENSIYHSPEIIQPDQTFTKFLVFPPLPQKDAKLKLEFDYMFFESKEMKNYFYFTQQKKGEGKKGTVYKNR